MELARDLERKLAHMRGIKKAVRGEANRIGGKARGRLASHRDTGEHTVKVSSGAVDAYVDLIGPAALTLETGRSGTRLRADGRGQGAMEPLNILRGSL